MQIGERVIVRQSGVDDYGHLDHEHSGREGRVVSVDDSANWPIRVEFDNDFFGLGRRASFVESELHILDEVSRVICTGINCEHCTGHISRVVEMDVTYLVICLECTSQPTTERK